MTEQQRVNRIPVGAIATLVVTTVAAIGGAAWWSWKEAQVPDTIPPSVTSVSPSPSISPSVSPQVEQKAEIYWLEDTGTNLKLVSQPVTITSDQPQVVLQTAFNNLLAGPKEPNLASTIPPGTQLRQVKVEADGIHVDLSQEFTTGGGSAGMIGRVAQVIYTATSLDPNNKVWIDVEGKPLEVLGGEGLELDQPMTRNSFKENFTL